MALDAEGIPQAADQIVELRGNLLAGRVIDRGKDGRAVMTMAVEGQGLGVCGRVRGRKGTRFANLCSYSVQCCFQPAERRAGVLEFCHGPLVYRV